MNLECCQRIRRELLLREAKLKSKEPTKQAHPYTHTHTISSQEHFFKDFKTVKRFGIYLHHNLKHYSNRQFQIPNAYWHIQHKKK